MEIGPSPFLSRRFNVGLAHEILFLQEFLQAVQRRGIAAHVISERHRFDRKLISSVREVVERVSPDIVQTNNVKSHFLIKTAAIGKRTRWIACHHGYTSTDLKMQCYNQLDRWSLPSAERVVTVCGPFKNQLVAAGVPSHKIRVIHNAGTPIQPVPADELSRLKLRLGIQQETKVLLSVGRLSAEKGHRDLVEAVDELRQFRPELRFKLLLVGFGPEKSRLEERVRRGLQGHVIFASNEADVVPLEKIADVFVLPSHTEGSPHVLMEAMAASVPIVATCVGGVPEILQDNETALLCRPRSPKLLAAAIARMLDSPEAARACVANAGRVLAEKFSPEVYAQSLLDVYSEVLQPS